MSSYNQNPIGQNQYAKVPDANDVELREAFEWYHRELVAVKDIPSHLERELGLKISLSTVKRRRNDLGLVGSRVNQREMSYSEKVQYIILELNDDPSKGRGVSTIRARIASNYGIHLPRDFVSDIMHIQDPDGFDLRKPTSKKVFRVRKAPIGINERWSGDGHNKLNSIGFPIWGVVDDATSKWIGAWVVPSNRLATVIGYLFLVLVEKMGGMPLQFTTDCGSETTQLYGLINALRNAFQANLDSSELPAHVYLRSVHNISIERSWLRLRLKWGNNAVIIFNRGIDAGLYNPDDIRQKQLCLWLWPRMLQCELDQFMEFQNGVRMRKDSKKAGPSGCSRNEAFLFPERWGGINCLQPVDLDVVREIKEKMGGEELLSFVSAEFANEAQKAFDSLGFSDRLTLGNVWVIFGRMLPILFP
uniref:Integrase core domain-containing protein n=1 Tax=Psilocybe cubensis TaxID=181762 RepID=A0A8H8CM95_PSICU